MAEIIKGYAVKPHEPKLVKKESFTAMLDAVTILDTARQQARDMLHEAEHARGEVFEEARRSGEAAGLHRYLEGINELESRLDGFYSSAEPELVRLAAGIARKIIGEELKTSPEVIITIAREAIASVRQARRVTLKVHPAHIDALRNNVHALDLGSSSDVQIIASNQVPHGGCLIETDLGIVDARLDTQMSVIDRLLSRNGRSS